MDRYIGLDVHATSTTAAIVNSRGKKLGTRVLETTACALVELLREQRGTVHVCLEEGTQAGWLVEELTPHAAEVVVTQVPKSKGNKSDRLDAFGLAEKLRRGAIDVRVFKHCGPYGKLRQLVKVHLASVRDLSRTQSRLKALYRSRGVRATGEEVYCPSAREQWIRRLPSGLWSSAELLHMQYDALLDIRGRAEREVVAECRRHDISRLLQTTPGLGPIRVARLLAIVVTPHRFRRRSQFWSYCGLGIVTRSSSDYVRLPDGRWVHMDVNQTRGLNRNHNRVLKDVFKGAATTVIGQQRQSPMSRDYQHLLDAGTKPNLAKLTLARKIAATALTMWKNEEEYDPERSSTMKR